MRPNNDDRLTNHMPVVDERAVGNLLHATGLKRLSPAWAKAEILGGLAAAAAGIKLLVGEGYLSWAGGTLFVLGAYLAMAGHRSHIYQSQNRLSAYLAQFIRNR